jgi:hypothetical protein
MIDNSIIVAMDYHNVAEQWLTNAIVKSIVEGTLGLSVSDSQWQFNWVEYYPVWTMDSATKMKSVKRMYVRFSGKEKNFLEVNKTQLDPHGLENYNEMLLLFEQSGASRASAEGIQIYKTRLDYH